MNTEKTRKDIYAHWTWRKLHLFKYLILPFFFFSYYLSFSCAESMKQVGMFILCGSQVSVFINGKWETVNYCEV